MPTRWVEFECPNCGARKRAELAQGAPYCNCTPTRGTYRFRMQLYQPRSVIQDPEWIYETMLERREAHRDAEDPHVRAMMLGEIAAYSYVLGLALWIPRNGEPVERPGERKKVHESGQS